MAVTAIGEVRLPPNLMGPNEPQVTTADLNRAAQEWQKNAFVNHTDLAASLAAERERLARILDGIFPVAAHVIRKDGAK